MRAIVGVATVGPPIVSSSSAAGAECELTGVGGVGGVALAGFAARFVADACSCWLKRRPRRVCWLWPNYNDLAPPCASDRARRRPTKALRQCLGHAQCGTGASWLRRSS